MPQAVEASRAMLNAALSAMSEGVAILDDQNRFVFWNQRYAELHPLGDRLKVGLPFSELLEMALAENVFPLAAGREAEWRQEQFLNGSRASAVLEQQLRNGSCLRVESIRTPDGGSIRVVVDITELKLRETALQATRAFLDGIIEHMPTTVVVRDRADRILMVNQAGEELFGLSRGEMIGHTLEESLASVGGAAVGSAGRHGILSGAVGVYHDEAISTSNIGLRFVRTQNLMLPAADGGEDLLLSLCEDVTGAKASADALRESEARYSALFNGISDPIFVMRALREGVFAFEAFNTACEQVFGLKIADVAGRPLEEVMPRRLVEKANATCTICIQTGRTAQVEQTFRLPNGEREFQFTAHPVMDAAGRATRVWFIAADVTDQRSTTAALRETEEQLSQIFESSADAMCVVAAQADGRWIYSRINPPHLQLTGRTEVETLGRSYQEVLRPEVAAMAQKNADLCAETKQQLEFETETEVNGRTFGVRTTFTPMVDPDGRVRRVLVVIKDISEQIEAKQRLGKSQKLEAIGQLAGGVAHDFNNLLLIMDGYARQALGAASRGEPVDEALAEVLNATKRGAALIKQLLVFSRRQLNETKVVRTLDVIEETRSLLKPLLGARYSLPLEADDAASGLCIETDPTELTQALINLATNARDAMPTGGPIKISVRGRDIDEAAARKHEHVKAGRFVEIRLSDKGTGISPQTLGKIFDPFFTTKEQGKGTGLGLAMVYGFVQQSGGIIDVRSQVGKGTAFRILLPVVAREPVIDAAEMQEDWMGQGETVLVVEDDEALLRLAKCTLEELGYRVLTAGNGMEALELEMEYDAPIDLVLSDVVMPALGGFEMAEIFRQNRPGVPVMFMTGYPTRGDLQTVTVPENAFLIHKPFQPPHLAQAMRRALAGEHGVYAPHRKDAA